MDKQDMKTIIDLDCKYKFIPEFDDEEDIPAGQFGYVKDKQNANFGSVFYKARKD